MSKNESADRTRGPQITLSTSLDSADEALVVGLIAAAPDSDDAPTLLLAADVLDDAQAAAISGALVAVGAGGSHGEVTRIAAPESLGVSVVVAVGLGDEAAVDDDEKVRQAAGVVARELDGFSTVATTLAAAALAPAVEGLFLGAYRFDEFRSAKSEPKKLPPTTIHLLTDDTGKAVKADLAHAVAVADAVAIARDFVNTPPSHLYPEEFAERARALGAKAGLKVEILDFASLEKEGYGGIVGVGKGSSRPPRLVRLTHAGKKSAKKVALVGKGITFDTGGISIKPAANMDQMTSDMGGAAAVIASTILASRLELEVTVTATVPMAENMPSGTAQRPGDVLTQYGGTTVEVLNTDAEGRLVLADAIVRACEDEPDYLIDTATLTGAQMVALGTRTPGVMGTDEFRDRVAALSAEVGENAWPMPLPAELRSDLKSRVADLANVTNHRWGGMLSAGLFLKEFVAEGVEWAHVDIAGPAFNSGGPWGYTPKGGTGVPVRTIARVLEDIAANG
ncbi:leucyl aminopeptidase [Gordonia sp. NB41Y]|uniref:leucyl aminopeptidase n=1 Tax=Gordonia sp. NB41Y TaxID=875808 RepID=UPI0006B1BB4B|nr:leucyl aminopeptidase [Gordonia sp. NB41Y]EMP10967.2 aminopeptidase A [Gordonia sp. NB41Y]WLP90339.1 leucyl aminopeptidase [Gordonia sp. NB41Y]